MCDTFVAMPSFTKNKTLIFGKNSDREPNEAQAIVRIPAKEPREKTVQCTYIAIPQVKQTAEVILSKPFQMWGAEMGVNYHGLVIGNEALFTKVKFKKTNQGLTGMDMLRLALERCPTAISALQLITDLLQDYGQDACGGYQNKDFFYHNSFIIADIKEAWVLETAGKEWVAQKVKDFRSISNGITIEHEFDLHSPNVVDFALRNGWTKKGEDFSFRKAYSDWFFTKMSSCKIRQQVSNDLGKAKTDHFDTKDALSILSHHHLENELFAPYKATTQDICMHATGLTNPSHTVGSMIAEIRHDQVPTIWLTGTSSPCLSIFKPFFFQTLTISEESFVQPTAKLDDSLWWKAERLHRFIAQNYQKAKHIIDAERIKLQETLLEQQIEIFTDQSPKATDLQVFSDNALQKHLDLMATWYEKLSTASSKRANYFAPMYQWHWKKWNESVII
ncbi:C69 family dipeptidase [Thermoflexibacter ruber]|uniref:Dipeptidase n=1 Tax=Thermoflexibacter ruber TaxID=1003 RepID=A0A1I2IG45_9BACT|nr:C69 family dipeptidase [Thermoflexibacter ruber]SFF41329.1 Dipeptidase [Thermoflexibacter ruber]